MPHLSKLALTFQAYQERQDVHPLTCGNDSAHAPLKPVVFDGDVVLRCPTCGYTQVVDERLVKLVESV